jgi:uncharacterized protein
MKRLLSHLPLHKRRELKAITEIIVKQVPATEMVILFGSHARGDWVHDVYEHEGITYEYASDYDILVITDRPDIAGSKTRWSSVERKIRRAAVSKTWTTLIVHDIDYVNRRIAKAAYFFCDIKKEGICLYNSGNHRLARFRKPNAAERLGEAKANFEAWMETARQAYAGFEDAMTRVHNQWAAFMLHQAAESLYHTLLLVFNGYKPKIHDLEKLGKLTSSFGKELLTVFPAATEEERQRFQLLRRAYTEARYDRAYRISKEELSYLAERVQRFREITEVLCTSRIARYQAEAAAEKREKREAESARREQGD